MSDSPERELESRVDLQAERMRQAQRRRPTLFAHTVYLGTLGLVFVLPIIFGAYLGNWLDSLMAGYSVRWTLSLIGLGVFLGGMNMYLLVKRQP